MAFRSGHEFVPDTPDAEDVNGAAWVVLDFFPEVGDMRIDGPVGDNGLPPGLVKDLVSRYDSPPAGDHKPKQVEFQGSQVKLLSLFENLMALEADLDVSELEDISRAVFFPG